MKKYLLLLAAAFLYGNSFAQTTEDSVKQAINNLFTSMKSADSSAVANAFSETAILQTIATDKEGKVGVKTQKVSEFAGFVVKQKTSSLDERINFETLKIDGDLASVWTPYLFYYNGSFRHCGVNSFQLIRANGLWKIQYLIDTRRKEPCKQ